MPKHLFVVSCLLLAIFFLVSASGCKKVGIGLEPEGLAQSGNFAMNPMPTAEMLQRLGPENDLDLQWTFSDTIFLVSGQPKKFLASPLGRDNEGFLAANMATTLLIPLNFAKIERLTVTFAPAVVNVKVQENGQDAIRQTLIFRRSIVAVFDTPIDREEILTPANTRANTSSDALKRTIGSTEYFDLTDPENTGPQRVIVHFSGDRTLVLCECFEQDIAGLFGPLALKPNNAVIARAKRLDIASSDLAVVASREGTTIDAQSLHEMLRSFQAMPPVLAEILAKNTHALMMTLKMEAEKDTPMLTIRLENVDEAGAKEIETEIQGLIVNGQTSMAAMNEAARTDISLSGDFATEALNAMTVKTQGLTVTFTIDKFEGFDQTFLSGVQSQKEMTVQMQVTQGKADQLAFMVRAYYAYYQQHKKFPSVIRAEDGRALLSWRVALLPVIGFQELYDKFKLDEPWDSETNKALLERMPPAFQSLGVDTGPTKTLVRRFDSEGTPFARPDLKPEDLTVPPLTLMFASVLPAHAVEWTRPEELTFEADQLDSLFGDALFFVNFMGQVDAFPLIPADQEQAVQQRKNIEAVIKGQPTPEMLQILKQQGIMIQPPVTTQPDSPKQEMQVPL